MALKRNQMLNIIEAFATYFVVFIHVPFPGKFGEIITALARVTVPFYFCVSGYFFFRNNQNNLGKTIKRKILRLAKTLIISEIVYFLYYLFLQMRHDGFSFTAITNLIKAEFFDYYVPDIINRITVFAPVFNGVTWFIATLIVVYCIEYFITKYNFHTISLIAFSLLMIFCLIGRRILKYFNITTELPYERFIFFLPLPFFEIGYVFNKYQEKIKNIKHIYSIIFIISGVFLTIIECLFDPSHTLYFGTCLIIAGLFVCFIQNSDYVPHFVILKHFNYIGENLTTNIYIYHNLIKMFFFSLISIVLPVINDNSVYIWIKPLLCCLITTSFSLFLHLLKIFISRIRKTFCYEHK